MSRPGPLEGVRVVDLSLGMAPALAVKLLVGGGAHVTRFECPAGDPFYDVYPAYAFWHKDKLQLPWSEAAVETALDEAELCIVGGEDWPGLDWSHDVAALRDNRPGLTLLEFRAEPPGMGSTPAVDLLLQARSGLCFEHFNDRPLAFAFPAPSYGAALNGLAAALACIYAQRRGAAGRHVSTSLLQGATFWAAGLWLDLDGVDPPGEPRTPKDPRQLIFRCSDGVFLQVTMGVPGALARLHTVLGMVSHQSNTDRGIPTGKGDPRNYFGDIDLLAPHFATREGLELLHALWAAGVVAEKVAAPGECWDDAQTRVNGVIDTAADGSRGIGLPFEVRPYGVSQAPVPPQAAPSGLPLEGVRVIDCGRFVAGPFASVLLADLGADVVKLEPVGGDPMRALLRQFAPAGRGKRSLAVDGKTPEGRRVVRRICASADIVHHNFRPGASARLGVDHASLSRDNPAIIVAESSAYGARGPKAGQPGFDMAFQAISGLEQRGGVFDRPLWCRFAAADYGTALQGAIGMLAALIGQTRRGGGAQVETNLLNGALFLMSELVQRPDGVFEGVSSPPDDDQLGAHPAERLYPLADGWIAVAARDDAMAARLLAEVGLPHGPPRRAWGRAELARIAAGLGGSTVDHALARLRAADVWAERCERDGWRRAKAEPAYAAVGLVGDGPAPGRGTLTQVMQAFTLDGEAPWRPARGLVDRLGGHSREVLREQAFGDPDIDTLFAKGVIA